MNCPSCGVSNRLDQIFCTSCGASLKTQAGGQPPTQPPGPPPTISGPGDGRGSSSLKLIAVTAVMTLLVAGVGYFAFARGKSASADEVLYQDKAAVGPSPFSPPADAAATAETPITGTVPPGTPVGSGDLHPTPFGGSGYNNVCKPELLIKFLGEHPDILKLWAKVLGIDPAKYVEYIHSLTPVILAQDARITNHGLKNGKVFGFQAILQAGTAVLVDPTGRMVVRCRCGNPLTPPITVVHCKGCPPGYIPPTPCLTEYVSPSPSPSPSPTPTPTRTPDFKTHPPTPPRTEHPPTPTATGLVLQSTPTAPPRTVPPPTGTTKPTGTP